MFNTIKQCFCFPIKTEKNIQKFISKTKKKKKILNRIKIIKMVKQNKNGVEKQNEKKKRNEIQNNIVFSK